MTPETPREPAPTIKHCMNCAYRTSDNFEYARCMLVGKFCETQRKWPSEPCDVNFSGWVHDGTGLRASPDALNNKPKTLFQRIFGL